MCRSLSHQKNGRSGNERMSEIIFELTGETRSRKHVSSHFQVMKAILRRSEELIAERFTSKEAREIRQNRLESSSAELTAFAQLPNSPSNTASTSRETISPYYDTKFGQHISSLSLVSPFYETECLDHLASNI